jgi:branched-chain amino acid transport system substrate-binding protein
MSSQIPWYRGAIAIACAVLALAAIPAKAQLLIGQTAGFTGPVAAGVKETVEGARLYFDAVNASGGVHGQPIELQSMDDRFDPRLGAANARKLAADARILALFLTRGTPNTEAILPVLAESRLALVGPSTGAMVLHSPVNPYVFNVRATYQREAERAVRHLSLIGIDRIAMMHADDSFGADAAAGAARGFSAANTQPLLHLTFDRAKPDFTPLAPRIAQSTAQAILIFGSGAAVAEAVKAIRAAGSSAQVVTLSNNASGGFVKAMGDHARGTIVTQVFPNERSLAAPMVREAARLAKARGMDGITPAMIEGFAAAKVLVEGLRRAGPNPTRESLIGALNGLRKFDLGGMEISYGPGDRTGLEFADLSIIDWQGRFRR